MNDSDKRDNLNELVLNLLKEQSELHARQLDLYFKSYSDNILKLKEAQSYFEEKARKSRIIKPISIILILVIAFGILIKFSCPNPISFSFEGLSLVQKCTGQTKTIAKTSRALTPTINSAQFQVSP